MEAAGGEAGLPAHPLPHIPHPPLALPSLSELAAAADAHEAAQQRKQSGSIPKRTAGDGVERFGESAAAEGGLGRFPGCEVMPLLTRFLSASPT